MKTNNSFLKIPILFSEALAFSGFEGEGWGNLGFAYRSTPCGKLGVTEKLFWRSLWGNNFVQPS